MAEKKKRTLPELTDGAPATLDELAREHGTSRVDIRKMHFWHGLRSGRPEHDFDDGKHNTTCMICGYKREDNGGADYESDRQKDK